MTKVYTYFKQRLLWSTVLMLLFVVKLVAQQDHGIPPFQPIESENTDVNFSNLNELLSTANFSSVLIVGIADMNADGLDDIIRLDNGRFLTIEYQSGGEEFFTYEFGAVSDDSEWSLTVADVDANGFNDLIVGGNQDGVKLLKANADGTDFEESILPESFFFIQGSNFVDINEDGLVDIFACSDLSENKIWENTGDGNFIDASDWIDMTTSPPSDGSGNYASVWTDFDNDGDLDLYLSKCKAGEMDPEAPTRVNQLFVNDGANNFTEMAEAYGLKIGAQSWTTDFQDIDNDGDLDCLVANHLEPAQLLANDGSGQYEDITFLSNVVVANEPFQSIMRDFDNDGFVDILAAGSNGYLYYRNNGNQSFTQVEGIFGDYLMGTFAIGDLNHDGFLDVYSGSEQSNDILWMNERNENHFLAIQLTTDVSNTNAIGTRLELYGDWGVQIREIRAGESYGIMNSYTKHFGLGVAETVDSLIVRWTSGNVEIFENPNVDQFLHIIESDCAYPDKNIMSDNGRKFCTGDTLILRAPVGQTYLWSNQSNASEIMIAEGGTYQVTVTNEFNCTQISNPIEIIQNPDETPVITSNSATTFCFGGSLFLFGSESENYQWSNGQETSSIVVFQTGEYTLTTSGLCADFTSEPISVQVIDVPPQPTVQNDTIYNPPETAVLTATGENLFWYDAPSGGNLLETGASLIIPNVMETTSFYVESVNQVGDLSCESNRAEVLAVVNIIDAAFEPLLNDFSIYPNPTNGVLTIEKKTMPEEEISLEVYNALGRLSKTKTLDNNNLLEHFNISELPSGLYTLVFHVNGKRFYHKLIVQK